MDMKYDPREILDWVIAAAFCAVVLAFVFGVFG